MSLKVLIADDHRIMLDGLRTILEKEHDIKIVGEAVDGRMTRSAQKSDRVNVPYTLTRFYTKKSLKKSTLFK